MCFFWKTRCRRYTLDVHREGSSEALLTELIVTSGGWKLAATCGSEVVANSLLSRSLLSSAFLIKKKGLFFWSQLMSHMKKTYVKSGFSSQVDFRFLISICFFWDDFCELNFWIRLNTSGQTTRLVNASRASLPRFWLSRFRSHVVTAFRPIRRDPRHRNSPWCHMMSMMSLAFRLFRLDKGEPLPGRHPIFQPINKGGPDAMLWFFWQHWEHVDEGLVSAQRIHWRRIFWLEVVAVAGKGGFVSYKSFKTAEFHSRHRRTVHGVGHSVILFELRSMEVNVPAKSSPWGSEEVPCDAEMKVWKFALHELEYILWNLCSDLVIYQRKFSQHPIYGVSKSQQKSNSKRKGT